MQPLKTLLLTSLGVAALALPVSAQIKSPAPSPGTELKQTVGLTHFTVQYSRPGVKGREIYGDLVPFGEVWRTGANAPTKISFDTEISFGGKAVPAGEYVLFSIPGKDEWTVILYGDSSVSNVGLYDEKKDVARATVKPTELASPVESFSISFEDLAAGSANLCIDWANVRVAVPITLDTEAAVTSSIKEAMKNMENWGAGDYAAASGYFAENDRDPAKALEFIAKAVELSPKAFYWQHAYAKQLAAMGKKEEAIKQAEESLAKAKENPGTDFGYIRLNENLLSTLR